MSWLPICFLHEFVSPFVSSTKSHLEIMYNHPSGYQVRMRISVWVIVMEKALQKTFWLSLLRYIVFTR